VHINPADPYRHRSSPLHHLDPRVKVVATLLYILTISLTPEGTWWTFGFFFFLILGTALLSSLGITFALRRSFVALPFVLAALALPFATPGPAVWRLPLLGWTISEPGLVRFVSVVVRAWLAVQAAILLTATTRFPDLLWVLSAFRFPRPLVSTIGFMYRYLFVLADEALRMLRARASRSARKAGTHRRTILWQGRMAGAMVGSLFLRALERSERIYAAMLSRGYDGQMRSLIRFHMRATDWVALILVAVLLTAPIAMNWWR
jgi:cobalt/nickel transport system permease protein